MQLSFLSFESLSRGRRKEGPFDLVIIDEAHHVRNPSTVRYRLLSRILRSSSVVMLSATPVHNSRKDLTALLSLFLGSRAQSVTERELARCVVRRRIESVGLDASIPHADGLVWQEVEDTSDIPRQLLALPPPVAPRNAGDGGVLITRALLRQWCSSDAALRSALRRRLARSIALAEALECGQYPTSRELSAWSFADDSVQLAFPAFVSTPSGACAELLVAVRQHQAALRRILDSLGADGDRDFQRAQILRKIRAAHAGVPIVAFSQYVETVQSLFRELRLERGTAVLTAKGARVAGGIITRREALSRFAPRATGSKPPRDIERIDLLLATDLLSEGINLQDAGVVVHLDLPWTAARLEQRIGRLRRIGSRHKSIVAYGIRPANVVETLIGLERTIERKILASEQSIGAGQPLLPIKRDEFVQRRRDDPLTVDERIRCILTKWNDIDEGHLASNAVRVAAVHAATGGFVALCAKGAHAILIGSDEVGVTDSPAKILRLLLTVGEQSREPDHLQIADAQEKIESWLFAQRTLALTGNETTTTVHARRKALRRISMITENARPHTRQQLLALAQDARERVLGRLGIAAESELGEVTSSALPDEDWLRLVIRTADSTERGAHAAESIQSSRLIALLLLDSSDNESR
jgi:hypothetical protein